MGILEITSFREVQDSTREFIISDENKLSLDSPISFDDLSVLQQLCSSDLQMISVTNYDTSYCKYADTLYIYDRFSDFDIRKEHPPLKPLKGDE